MKKKILLLLSFLVLIMLALEQSKSITRFLDVVKSGESRLVLAEQETRLLAEIQAEAARRNILPINAKVDPVWKAIPGYNGLEVDVEKTLLLADQSPAGAPIHYVMKETSPSVGLEDLGPHPIYKGNPKKPMVALMINVAWGNEFLPVMLETLKRENVHATFFFDGSWLKQNIELARQIGSLGHELSNHAYSHKNMSQLSRQKAIEEISRTQSLLEKELGVSNKLFAPPSGDFDQETVQIAAGLKLKTILWTLDTVDWTHPGASRIIQKIESRVEPGFLILMHPTVSSSQALDGIIKIIKRKGYSLGTVSELLSPTRVPEPTLQS